jgi:hypothetical protein
MSKRQLLSLIGIWNIFFLFLGIPDTWDKIISGIMGLIIILIAYKIPHEYKKTEINKNDGAFIENK